MTVEAPVATEVVLDEALIEPDRDQRDLAELVEGYLAEGDDDADRDRVMAAFDAGTVLQTVAPVEVFDVIDRKNVRVPKGAFLVVASHEGDVLVGELADNSHSLGVLYEESHRWYQRKYFLPLALLTNREMIQIDPELDGEAPVSRAPTKGMELSGEDRHTEVAVRRIEALSLRDEVAFLPRGVTLIFRRGVVATDPLSGDSVTLPPQTEAEVLAAVGDMLDLGDGDFPPVQIQVGERVLTVPFETIAELDPDQDVLTYVDIARRQTQVISRRQTLRRLVGVGFGAAFLAADAGVYFVRRDAKPATRHAPQLTLDTDTAPEQARLNHQTLAAIIPQASALYGYFSAGNQYWWKLRGAIMDLRAQQCQPTVEALADPLKRVSAVSSSLWETYSQVYRRRVHTGWTETRHYETDKEGRNRRYTHSTWSKRYSTMWVEPHGNQGLYHTLGGWSDADEHRYQRADTLANHPLFDLLAADPEHAERTFEVKKSVVGFGRDAAVSMISMALLTLPPAFYEEIVTLATKAPHPNWTAVGPQRGFIPYQKEATQIAGLAAGVVLARRYQRKLNVRMAENKYELGQTLESEIRRVPTLELDAAFAEFFGQPEPAGLVSAVGRRQQVLGRASRHFHGFRYAYGTGWDNGRPLDSIYVDPSPLSRALPRIQPRWATFARQLRTFFADTTHRERLLPVLRNAIGTETVEARIAEDRTEASGASFARSLWFAAPLYGAVMLDSLLKQLS